MIRRAVTFSTVQNHRPHGNGTVTFLAQRHIAVGEYCVHVFCDVRQIIQKVRLSRQHPARRTIARGNVEHGSPCRRSGLSHESQMEPTPRVSLPGRPYFLGCGWMHGAREEVAVLWRSPAESQSFTTYHIFYIRLLYDLSITSIYSDLLFMTLNKSLR